MMDAQKHYQFINSLTGNVIAYLSLPEDADKNIIQGLLEKKRIQAAIENQLSLDLIYWQDEAFLIN